MRAITQREKYFHIPSAECLEIELRYRKPLSQKKKLLGLETA